MENNKNNKGNESEEELSPKFVTMVQQFFPKFGTEGTIPPHCNTKDSYSRLLKGTLKVHKLERAKVSCFLTVKPTITNVYGGMHGGAVASVAELVAIACARTVVGKDRDLFLGELSISYLSAAQGNAELTVDASVVRTGRNLTAVAVEFRLGKTKKLVYTSRATFFNMPVASL